MRSREVQQYIASITGRPIGEIDQRCRPLREALKIPTGARGLSAPHMDLASAMFHLLMLPARRVGDAFDVASRLLDLRLVPHPDFPGLTECFQGDARKLQVFLVQAMRRGYGSVGFDFQSFELFESGDYAVLNLHRRSLKNLRFLFSGKAEHWSAGEDKRAEIYGSVETMTAGNRFVLGVDHMFALGRMIEADVPVTESDVVDIDTTKFNVVATGGADGAL